MMWGKAICLWAAICGAVSSAQAQSLRDTIARPQAGPSALDRLVRAANVWDLNNDQVYSCAEWKAYAGSLFSKADSNRDGHLDPQEFKAIQSADPQFRESSVAYFDDNRDGRASRSEFVDKPNPFFLQFDKDSDCRVTLEDIVAAATPAGAGRRRLER